MEKNINDQPLEEKKVKSKEEKEKIEAHVFKNFVKEIKRVRWPTEKKKQKNFLLTFLLITVLIIFFALISLGASELIKAMGAN